MARGIRIGEASTANLLVNELAAGVPDTDLRTHEDVLFYGIPLRSTIEDTIGSDPDHYSQLDDMSVLGSQRLFDDDFGCYYTKLASDVGTIPGGAASEHGKGGTIWSAYKWFNKDTAEFAPHGIRFGPTYEAYMRYMFKPHASIGEGFWEQGMKMPGLAGGDATHGPDFYAATSLLNPTDQEQAAGHIQLSTYGQAKWASPNGDSHDFEHKYEQFGWYLNYEQWYSIECYIKMNQAIDGGDGEWAIWIDDELKVHWTGINWWHTYDITGNRPQNLPEIFELQNNIFHNSTPTTKMHFSLMGCIIATRRIGRARTI